MDDGLLTNQYLLPDYLIPNTYYLITHHYLATY